MNKKQITLFFSVFLVCLPINAQQIVLNNGDTLDVTLIRQTDSTLTFSHPVLGDQTIDKLKVSNLGELNLETLDKVPEGDEGKALVAARAAKNDTVFAKQELDAANAELSNAKAGVAAAAKPEEVSATNAAMTAAKTTYSAAEEKLVLSVEAANVAEKQAIMAKEVRLASEQVVLAKENEEAAAKQVRATKREVEASEKQVDFAKQELENAAPAGITLAEESIEVAKKQTDIAEEKVEIAEDQAEEAKEKIVVAEDQVKLAKGEKVNDGFMGTGWFKDWDSSLSIGLSGSSGSSVNNTFRTAFNTRYEDEQGRWDYKSFYFRDSENNVTGENQINATLVKDWFFEDTKWFAFATGVYGWNQFKDWDHRLQFGGGPGYQFIKTEQWEFSGRAGATLVTEFGKTQFDGNGNPILNPDGSESEETVVSLEGLIGADVTWHITAKQHFSISNYFYPSLTDSGQFRNLTNISWIHSLDWFEGLALKFGIRNEYNTSETIPNEFNYNFSVLWGF